MVEVEIGQAKELISEMCRNFYDQGWVSGTGGGMSIKAGDKIVMAPSGVQKERMQSSDMFVLDKSGNVIQSPVQQAASKPPKLSECSPLFMSAYELRGAGAVLHSHSINAVMATLLQQHPGRNCAGEFRVTNLEMIKGIAGHGYYDTCVVPIIENTARECELTASLREAIKNYPKANAVLVKRHGVYVWGDDWVKAKTQAECYEYLFEAAVKLTTLGIDVSIPPPATHMNGNGKHIHQGKRAAEEMQSMSKKAKLEHTAPPGGSIDESLRPSAIVLDIEGTIAPISFVTEKLFPYARAHLGDYLQSTFDTPETQADIALLQDEAKKACSAAAVGHPCDLAAIENAGRKATIEAVMGYVNALMAEDKKSTGLKALQGHIWRQGFKNGAIRSELFPDFATELRQWHSQGIKVYIYSSGSREAQKSLMTYTADGDLRPHLSGFFDTTSGAKVEAGSYQNILLSLGLDDPKDVLFATDSVKEAEAASQAGWSVAITQRPGNASLPPDAGSRFRIIGSMADLVQG